MEISVDRVIISWRNAAEPRMMSSFTVVIDLFYSGYRDERKSEDHEDSPSLSFLFGLSGNMNIVSILKEKKAVASQMLHQPSFFYDDARHR